ncbi:cell cycle control protein [Colletotrichum higginsianum]|nr:cell cycle control protein [Colletotrichum higginsianum]
MDTSRDSSNLLDTHNRLIADVLSRFRMLTMLATIQAEGERKNAEPQTVAVTGMSMQMEFEGLHTSIKDLLALSRRLKELWLFGKLGRGEGDARIQADKLQADVVRCAELLNAIQESRPCLTVAVLGILVLVANLRLESLRALLVFAGADPAGVNAAGRQPQKVVRLEVVHLLEEDVEPVGRTAVASGLNSRVLLLLDLEDALVDLLVLERLELFVVLAKVDRLLAKVVLGAAVVGVEDGPLEQQAQAGRLGDGDPRRAVALLDALERRRAADDEGGHADHLADLVHHEALAVYLERHPLGVADLDRLRVDLEGLDVALGRRVLEALLDRVVVEVDGAAVLVQRRLELAQALGRDAVPSLGGDVGRLDVAQGEVEGGQVAVPRLDASLGDFGSGLDFRRGLGRLGRLGSGRHDGLRRLLLGLGLGIGGSLGLLRLASGRGLVGVYPLHHLGPGLRVELVEDGLDVLLVNLSPVALDIGQLLLELFVVSLLLGHLHQLLPQPAVRVGRQEALKELLVRWMPQTRIWSGRLALILSTISSSSMMSFKLMTLPAAWTPLSVLAQRTRLDFLWSSALALEMAPAATKALKRSPSIVFSSLLICIPLYPVPE